MQSPPLPLETVSERDIDLLLLEELTVSENFARWFVKQASFSGSVLQRVESVRHSVSDASGESDLEIVFLDSHGRRLGLLVENKISAPGQPDQADRYRQRALRGVDAGSWEQAQICIVAPKAYLEASSGAQGYDAKASYEDIKSWFEEESGYGPRAVYRASVIEAALQQARRGYTLVKDEAVTAFWKKYWVDAADLFPELEMQEPNDRGAQATWIVFRPKRLGAPRSLNHKLTMGVVDLNTEYPASRVPELNSTWARLLESDMAVVALDIQADYARQVTEARAGMRAAYRLLYLSRALVARDASRDHVGGDE